MHMSDPVSLMAPFRRGSGWNRSIAAGARPARRDPGASACAWRKACSPPRVAAAFAMAIGTAVDDGRAGVRRVFAKATAMRLAARKIARLALVAKGFEFAAALAVLAFGGALLVGAQGGGV